MDNEKPIVGARAPDRENDGLREPGADTDTMRDDKPLWRDKPVWDAAAETRVPDAHTHVSNAQTTVPNERTSVFGQLVADDGDIAGLVAYSIYKQNKLDWLNAFETEKGRVPTADEVSAYIIGEGTPRRIATYRHLAEATLAGRGPSVPGASSSAASFRGMSGVSGPALNTRQPGNSGAKTALTTGLIAIYAVIAVLFLIGFLLAAHYTMSSR